MMWRKTDAAACFCAVYLFSSAYLGGTAEATLFYMSNVLFHVAGGLLLCVLVGYGLKAGWKSQTALGRLLVTMICLGLGSGLLLACTGATRPFYWLLCGHVSLSGIGVVGIFTVKGTRQRLLSQMGASLRSRQLLSLGAHSVWVLPGLLVLMHSQERWPYRIANSPEAPLTMEEETAVPRGPFFPSAAETADGKLIPARFFMESESCGTAGCHPDILKQWESSVHHLASFNNQWYRKSIEYMQDVAGVKASKWCGGCHDHAVLFSGMMDTPIRDIVHTPEANAGLGCVSCHSIVGVKNTMGNGGFIIEYPQLHDLATSKNPLLRSAHDYLTKVDPEPHRALFLKPFHRQQSSEFCSACHKVHLDVPVNSYRWMRGFNEYDPWQGSGVSGQSARAFYYPDQPKGCNDCHMPLVKSGDAGNREGQVHSHRFAAANSALPTAYRDSEQLQAVRRNLESKIVSVDIFALGRGPAEEAPAGEYDVELPDPMRPSTSFPEPEELGVAARHSPKAIPEYAIFAPLDAARPVIAPGDSLRVDVVVRTLGLGHFFPGGTVDGFDVWVELKAEDERGRVLFWSGSVEEAGRGRVEPGAHFYRSFLLDANGNPINKRNAWAARSLLYVRLVPPGAADTVHYRLEVPSDASGDIKLTARVNYRKFAWWNTQWAYAGVRDPLQAKFQIGPDFDDGLWVFSGDLAQVSGTLKSIPELPIITVAENAVTLKVAPADHSAAQKPVYRKEDRTRWNDYGIGLLLQGDLKGAQRAFSAVTEVDPGYADGWVNLARVQVQQGNPAEALRMTEKALALSPKLGKAHYFNGLALKAQGRYEESMAHLRKALELFPRDKVVRNQAGRVLFLQRRFAEAVAEFYEVLRIDTEDLQAHYNLMLCYQGLGKAAKAEREKQLYLRYKANESSQVVTGEYRRGHPADNNERQQIHEHRSTVQPAAPKTAGEMPATPGGRREAGVGR